MPSRPPATAAFPRSLLVSIDLRAGRVHVAGRLEAPGAHHLLDALQALAVAAHPVWFVDTAATTGCDDTGVRALATAQALAAGCGRELRVVHVPPCLAEPLERAGLGGLLRPPAARGDGPPQTPAGHAAAPRRVRG